ncbi:hypothetical protein EVA_21543, partial [gut metagenome]
METTKFYPIMQVLANSADRNNDYVKDPNFEGQTKETRADFYSKDFNKSIDFNTPSDIITTSLDKGPACFYTLENTMIAEQQMNGYTTGLYYKATYT